MAYLNRVFDLRLKAHLKAMGAVLIEGPKWCGKTTTAKQLANSVISLQDTDHREEYLATAITKPSFLLEGEVPRLIDEWQDAQCYGMQCAQRLMSVACLVNSY